MHLKVCNPIPLIVVVSGSNTLVVEERAGLWLSFRVVSFLLVLLVGDLFTGLIKYYIYKKHL